MLRNVGPSGRRFGSLTVPAETFESEFRVSLSLAQRGSLRGAVLKALAGEGDIPKGATDTQLESAEAFLRARGFIHDVDGDIELTTEGTRFLKQGTNE